MHSYAEFFDCNSQTQFGIEFFEEVFFLYFSARESRQTTSSQANVTDLWKYFFHKPEQLSAARRSLAFFFFRLCVGHWTCAGCNFYYFILFYLFHTHSPSAQFTSQQRALTAARSLKRRMRRREWVKAGQDARGEVCVWKKYSYICKQQEANI